MEILVAVDKKMQEYHGDETRNYVLTLMSIVSQRPHLFVAPSVITHPYLRSTTRYLISLPTPVLATQSVLRWSI